VSPLERAIRSGWIPAFWQANRAPVRPKPVKTSSVMMVLRWFLVIIYSQDWTSRR
jgi:hypothetical protein